MAEIMALYCDGGVVKMNPSPYAGVWAYVALDEAGAWVWGGSGVILACPGGTVSSNVSELWAAVSALEAMPDGWAGGLYSDSQVTLGRLGRLPGQQVGWALKGVPDPLRARMHAVLQRLGPFTGVLLQGHPTAAELRAGVGHRGTPVSRWNVACDQECGRLAVAYLAQQGAAA